jgi:hypothetical protein
MIKKRWLPLLAVLLFSFGCSKAGGRAGYDARAPRPAAQSMALYETAAMEQADRLDSRNASGASQDMSVLENTERKLVRSANVRIRAENLDVANASVTALMEKHGAYAASTAVEENSRYYSIRVPSTEYNAFLAGTEGMGRMLNRYENTEDVTLRYYDLEGRLATKRELLATFQSYLGKAQSIEEILSVEVRLAELHNEIDGTGRELRNLANRVDYATIDLTLLGPVASSPYRGPTLKDRIGQLFGGFGGFLSAVAVVIVGIVVYGVPVLLLLTLFFWLFFGRIGLVKKLWRLVTDKRVSKKNGI